MPSHAQVRFPLCSLLLLLSCFCFYCSYCYYYYYYGYLLAKGFYHSSGYEYKPGHFNKQNFFLVLCFLLFSLSPLMTIIWVYGNLTHMISPVGSSLLLAALPFSLSPLMTIIWVYGNLYNPYDIISLLFTFARCSPLLSSPSDDHYVGLR